VSVGSYNANTRYGRVFDYDVGKTIPFDLHPDVDYTTVEVLLDSITNYALAQTGTQGLASAVAVKYTSINSVDGRTKKFIIHKARRELRDL
jgi:hypothetical protein